MILEGERKSAVPGEKPGNYKEDQLRKFHSRETRH